MNNQSLRLTHFAILFSFAILSSLIVSCLSSDTVEFPSAIQVNYSVSNLNTDIVRGQDTISVLNARFVFNNIQLIESSGLVNLLDQEAIVIYSQLNNNQPLLLAVREIQGGAYTGLDVDIVSPPSDANVELPNSSIVINGRINNSLFQYASSFTFERSFFFDSTLTLDDVNDRISTLIQSNAGRWFVDPTSNALLHPDSASNAGIINSNITSSFNITTDVF